MAKNGKAFLEHGGIVAFREALFDVAVPSILDDFQNSGHTLSKHK